MNYHVVPRAVLMFCTKNVRLVDSLASEASVSAWEWDVNEGSRKV